MVIGFCVGIGGVDDVLIGGCLCNGGDYCGCNCVDRDWIVVFDCVVEFCGLVIIVGVVFCDVCVDYFWYGYVDNGGLCGCGVGDCVGDY